jgi:hypothetical protein
LNPATQAWILLLWGWWIQEFNIKDTHFGNQSQGARMRHMSLTDMSVECGKPLLGWQKDKDLDMKMYASKRHWSPAITASVPWGIRSTAPTLWNLCTSVTYPILSHKSEASSFTEETSVSWDARNLKLHLSKLQGQSWYPFSWQEKWILQYSKSPESSISLQHWYEQEHHERNSHITDELPMMNLQKTNQIPEGDHQNTQLVSEILLRCTDSKKTTQFRNGHLYRVPTELNEIKANMPANTGRNHTSLAWKMVSQRTYALKTG